MSLNKNFPRYGWLGGIRAAIKGYEEGKLTIAEIAKGSGCTGTTVRNDILKYVGGHEAYVRLLMRIKSSRSQIMRLDLDAARIYLKKNLSELQPAVRENAMLLSKLLHQVQLEGVSMDVVLRGSSMRFFLGDNRPINIRLAAPDEQQTEHAFGLHRFKITKALDKYSFSIFAIEGSKGLVIYIFDVRDIWTLNSLVLRYKWFDRGSKYEYARDAWSTLKR